MQRPPSSGTAAPRPDVVPGGGADPGAPVLADGAVCGAQEARGRPPEGDDRDAAAQSSTQQGE